MTTIALSPTGSNHSFHAVAESFLQADGLPFADVLSAEYIEQVFRDHGALFGQDDIFSTQIVLWAFLSQALRDGKGASCAAAVCNIAIGPYAGKETGETALLRGMLDAFDEGDVAVFDRYYCSFMMIAMFHQRGADVCARLHQCRSNDFRRGRRLGKYDHLITWTRPARPPWMSKDVYAQIPATLTLREIRFSVEVPGRRTETLTVVTTLIDPNEYSAADIAELYGFRWNVELDIRDIKQTLGLDHVRCKTPHMVRRELWVTLLAYVLVRKVIATSAAVHDKQPRQLGFTLACQAILASRMLLATGCCRDPRQLWAAALERIARNEVANRPGRVEPRVLKRRRHGYPLMRRARQELQEEARKM